MATPMDYNPYDSEDIVDYFQDLPVVRNFRLGGWTASANCLWGVCGTIWCMVL